MKYRLFAILLATANCLHAAPEILTVSAAISLKAPLEALKTEYEKANPGSSVVFNFGSSGALQQQIVNGAPVDIFISAAAKQMDDLEKAGLIVTESRCVVAGNTLVLIAPLNSQTPLNFDDLASPAVKTLSIGEPQSVPVGAYAMEVLQSLGLADALKGRLVLAKDARQVLAYVESGNADAGIVYGSDAAGSKSIRQVAPAPAASHKAIEYPAAIVKSTGHPSQAAAFIELLKSPRAAALFKSAGFVTNSSP